MVIKCGSRRVIQSDSTQTILYSYIHGDNEIPSSVKTVLLPIYTVKLYIKIALNCTLYLL